MTLRFACGAGVAVSIAVAAAFAGGGAQAVGLDMLTITAPADISTPATTPCGATNCAPVSFSFTVAGGVPPYSLVCTPANSGDLFTVGSHIERCLAQDSAGNSTSYASFTITVTDGGLSPPPPPPPPPPTLAITAPADITAQATVPCLSTYCAPVSFSFNVTGGFPPYNLVCNFSSGSLFTVGRTTVSCLAQDSHGNSTPDASFTVTVTPPSAPPAPTTTSVTTTAAGPTAATPGTSTTAATTATSGSNAPPPPQSSAPSPSPSTSPPPAPGAAASAPSAAPAASVTAPAVKSSSSGKQTISFSIRLTSAAALGVTLRGANGKVVLRFTTRAAAGHSDVTHLIQGHLLKAGSRAVLEVDVVRGGRHHTYTLRFVV